MMNDWRIILIFVGAAALLLVCLYGLLYFVVPSVKNKTNQGVTWLLGEFKEFFEGLKQMVAESKNKSKLLDCPDCGHQVSVNADNCPECGSVLKESSQTQTKPNSQPSVNFGCCLLYILVFIAIIVLVLVALGVFGSFVMVMTDGRQ